MKKLEIPADRFGEFEAGLSKALAMASDGNCKTIVVLGRTGSGKSVLASAFAEKHKEVTFIKGDRQQLAAGQKQFLNIADRLRPCIIDEPRWCGNLQDFICADGAPIVLLLQNKQWDGDFIGIDLSESYELQVVDYRTWCAIAGEPCL